MARPSNTEKRREQIIDGLLKVLATRGYEGASTQEIAKAAGLTAGLVHYHFKGKHEILLGLVERLEQRLRTRVERWTAAAPAAPSARLAAFIDAHLARGTDADPDAVKAWVVLCAEALRDPEVRTLFAQVLVRDQADLEDRVRAALVDRGRLPSSTRPIAAAVLAAIQGYFVFSAASPDLTPPGTAANAVRRMTEGLLTAAPEQRSGRRAAATEAR